MATILIISGDGHGIPLAMRMAQDGHIVKIWMKEKTKSKALTGFTNPSRISNYRSLMEQYDLVLSDMVGNGVILDDLSEKGKVTLGGGSFNDKLELDRAYALKVVNAALPIKTPHSVVCRTKDDLKKALKSGEALVIKPLGNKSTSLTLVSDDKKNRSLLSYVESMSDELLPCIAQERIDGIEISTEGWFNGETWVKPFNHTIEQKRFMDGDKGPNTGCMGNVVWVVEDSDRLVEMALEPLGDLLKKVKYVGPIDVNCICTKDEAYFLEFTARFGYDAVQAYLELLKMPVFEYLYQIATGGDSIQYQRNQNAIAVRLSLNPWPNTESDFSDQVGVKVLDVPKEAMNHVWLMDVMQNNGDYTLAGVDGCIGCVTARGTDIREARRRVYRTINNIVIHQDVQYRGDIGRKVENEIFQLKSWGWL